MPLASHVSGTPVAEQAMDPGAQVPTQADATQAWLTHAASGCQAPVASQIAGVVAFAQEAEPGVHAPTQAPSTQAWSVHGAPADCQAPATQTCGS